MATIRQIARRPFLALLAPSWVLRSETAGLNLRVTTGGRPAVARVYIAGPDGKQLTIPGAISYARRVEIHSIVDRSVFVSLPSGKYIVRAEKGAEFRGVEKSIDLPGGGTRALDLDIPRFCDM